MSAKYKGGKKVKDNHQNENYVKTRRKLQNGKYETLTFHNKNRTVSYFVDWTKGKIVKLIPEDQQ